MTNTISNQKEDNLKIAIISGSHREASQSLKVANYATEWIGRNLPHVKTSRISLENNPLPLWDEGVWNNETKWTELWSNISGELGSSDGFVVVTPEWGGMAPSGLKNFFLLCKPEEIGHKPALIVSVSSGMGGSYPVAELRMSSYKNNRLCYIPEHLIIRNVGECLNDFDKEAGDNDRYIRYRIAHCLKLLQQYAIALKSVRQSGVIDYNKFPFGM